MSNVASSSESAHRWGSAPDFVGPRHEYREALIRRTLVPALRGRRVLNAGCGAGSMTMGLLEAGLDVTSVDASPEFVSHLTQRIATSMPGSGASVELGDLHHLRFHDQSFDAVVCGEVLEHLDDDIAALREFTRVLVPGGLVVVSVPANPWRFDWVDAWAGHRRRYTLGDLEARMRDAGLVDIAVTSWGFPFTGLYHRHVYRPLLRRRLARGAAPPSAGGRMGCVAARVLRVLFEIDTVFRGRVPGWFGLIASARRPPERDTT